MVASWFLRVLSGGGWCGTHGLSCLPIDTGNAPNLPPAMHSARSGGGSIQLFPSTRAQLDRPEVSRRHSQVTVGLPSLQLANLNNLALETPRPATTHRWPARSHVTTARPCSSGSR